MTGKQKIEILHFMLCPAAYRAIGKRNALKYKR